MKFQINNVNNVTDPEVNQAVISQLRRQYPDLRIAGKKIRVVSSQGDEMTDPSRLKITKITRVVRQFNPEVVANNDASSEDEEKFYWKRETRWIGAVIQEGSKVGSCLLISRVTLETYQESSTILA